MGNYGDYLRKRRLELGWTQKRTATELGVSEDTLRDWELGKQDPKPSRLPKIIQFLGTDPKIDRYEVARLIREIRDRSGCSSYDALADQIGICADTLVNLKNGRYQPTRRTYRRLKNFADALET